MEDILFHLPNVGLEGLESFFIVFFYVHINASSIVHSQL